MYETRRMIAFCRQFRYTGYVCPFWPCDVFRTGLRHFFDKEEPSAAAAGCAPHTNHIMEQMLICLSLALIVGLLMSRAAKAVRLPAVTAYLLTGLLLGPFFLGRLS